MTKILANKNELLAMIDDLLHLTHLADHAWEDSDYALRDRIQERRTEIETERTAPSAAATGVRLEPHSQAVNLLSGMVFGYKPLLSKSGGYKCMFCGATIRVSADIARAKYHTETCVWIRARTWLDALEQHPSAQDGAVTDVAI